MNGVPIYFTIKDVAERIKVSENLLNHLYRQKHPLIEPRDAFTPKSMPLWEAKTANKMIKNFKEKDFEDAILLSSGLKLYPAAIMDNRLFSTEYYLYCLDSVAGYEMICVKSGQVYQVHDYQGKSWKLHSEPMQFEYAGELAQKCEERKSDFVMYKE